MTETTTHKIHHPAATLRGRRFEFDGTREGLVLAAIDAGAEIGDRIVVPAWDRTLKMVEDDEHGVWAR